MIDQDNLVAAVDEWRVLEVAHKLVRYASLVGRYHVDDLLSEKRTDELARLRWGVMLTLRDKYGWPITKIARFFERGHPGVIRGMRKADGLLRTDVTFAAYVAGLKAIEP